MRRWLLYYSPKPLRRIARILHCWLREHDWLDSRVGVKKPGHELQCRLCGKTRPRKKKRPLSPYL